MTTGPLAGEGADEAVVAGLVTGPVQVHLHDLAVGQLVARAHLAVEQLDGHVVGGEGAEGDHGADAAGGADLEGGGVAVDAGQAHRRPGRGDACLPTGQVPGLGPGSGGHGVGS